MRIARCHHCDYAYDVEDAAFVCELYHKPLIGGAVRLPPQHMCSRNCLDNHLKAAHGIVLREKAL